MNVTISKIDPNQDGLTREERCDAELNLREVAREYEAASVTARYAVLDLLRISLDWGIRTGDSALLCAASSALVILEGSWCQEPGGEYETDGTVDR